MDNFDDLLNKTKSIWDNCSNIYEEKIVNGHPDITAYENFEEDFIDSILKHIIKEKNKLIKLMDIGCGSGRLHIRYYLKTMKDNKNNIKEKVNFNPVIAKGLKEVWGIDFSKRMIDLAKIKYNKIQKNNHNSLQVTFLCGSAFDIKIKKEDGVVPIIVCLINTIGVMQDLLGAEKLFKTIKEIVDGNDGIAIISCYMKKYLKSFGLGQYESTMDVSGQPKWLVPITYSSNKLIPKKFKKAFSKDESIFIDVYNDSDVLIKENYALKRDAKLKKKVLKSGRIETYSGYISNWYSFKQIKEWIDAYWGGKKKSYHIKTIKIDAVRAKPGQLAIYDPNGYLKDLLKRKYII